LSCAAEDVVAAAERAVSERDLHFKNAKVSLQRWAEADAAEWSGRRRRTKRIAVVSRFFQEDSQPEYLFSFSAALARTEKTVRCWRERAWAPDFRAAPFGGEDMNAGAEAGAERFGGKGGGSRIRAWEVE